MDSVTAKQGFAKLPELSFWHRNVPSDPFRDAGGPPVRRFFSGAVQKREVACEVGRLDQGAVGTSGTDQFPPQNELS